MLDSQGLSPRFDPFLPHFARETIRFGGEVWVAPAEGRIEGLLLTDPTGPVGSAFTRSAAITAGFRATSPTLAIFSELPPVGASEPYEVFAIDLGREESPPSIRHRMRLASSDDGPALRTLAQCAFGLANAPASSLLPADGERAIVAELDGEVVGAGWTCVVGGAARLHSLAVSAPFRGLGVGTDLIRARLRWAFAQGASSAFSEIARSNVASRAAAAAAGMRPVGTISLLPPLEGGPG